MKCLEVNQLCLSAFYDYCKNMPEFVILNVITISEGSHLDEFQISGKMFERPLNDARITRRSDPGTIDGIYLTVSPDDETLLIIIDDLKGNVHLISNDCIYVQYAMIKYAFRDRLHFYQYHDECDIKEFDVSYNENSEVKKCYFSTFVKEMELFYQLKEKGIKLF